MRVHEALAVGLVAIVSLAGCVGQATDDDEAPLPTTPRSTVSAPLCHPWCFPTFHEVRIAPTIINATSESTAVVTPIMLDAIRSQLATDPNIDVDEGSDPTTSSNARMVRGRLTSVTFASGELKVKVGLDVFTYPGLNLVGTLSQTVTAQVAAPTQALENQLISIATAHVTQRFMQTLE